jgi:hypothetical protein
MTRKKAIVSRPKDESFDAFKAWQAEFFEKLTGKPFVWNEERIRTAERTWKKMQKMDE